MTIQAAIPTRVTAQRRGSGLLGVGSDEDSTWEAL
jgi:hypothetical protein